MSVRAKLGGCFGSNFEGVQFTEVWKALRLIYSQRSR